MMQDSFKTMQTDYRKHRRYTIITFVTKK